MGIFGRIFKIGQAETNAAIDKLENPIKMTEQGIRDLKKDLDGSLKAYAEVKALAIRSKRDAADAKSQATDYEQKAIMLISKAEGGAIDTAEADRLASEALARKEEAVERATKAEADARKIEGNLVQLDGNIKKLRSMISKYENELKTLVARSKVSDATAKLNKQMANIDSNGTVAMLEKMKDKVAEKEALSDAYGDLADSNKSIDDEIDAALNSGEAAGRLNPGGSAALEELKAKLKAKN